MQKTLEETMGINIFMRVHVLSFCLTQYFLVTLKAAFIDAMLTLAFGCGIIITPITSRYWTHNPCPT